MRPVMPPPFIGVQLPVEFNITGGCASGQAHLRGPDADEVVYHTLDTLAYNADTTQEELLCLLRFLLSDPELQDRFTAFKAGERILEGAKG